LLTRNSPGKIFISYRRDDARGVAGRLMDTLSEYFGEGRVFRDIEGIVGGAKFEEVLSGTIGSADAVIVLIGPDWLNMTDASGRRRLDDPNDWVAHEIAAALQKQLPVFPVLIEDTPMPRAQDLPEGLKPLVRHNAISISDRRWAFDVTRLAKVVAFDIPGSANEKKLDRIRLVISLALFATVLFTTGTVAWKSYQLLLQLALPEKTPILALWESGISHMVIMASAVLLLVSGPLVDVSRRRYVYASGIIGGLGTLICFVLLDPLNTLQEPIAMFFGSTIIATAMLVFMNLSGFKPK